MTDRLTLDRRTTVKTIGAGVLAGATMTGSSGADFRVNGGTDNTIEIVGGHDHETHEHSLELSSASVSSGWTTLAFVNETSHTHLIYGVMLPDAEEKLAEFEGATLAEKYTNAVTIPFQEAWDPYWAGDATVDEFLAALGENLPAWFFEEVLPVGGPGLTAGETTAKTTLNLAPGTYFFECYVMNDEGVFHSRNGMLTSLEVTEETADAAEPEPTLDVTVSSDGIDFDGSDVAPGHHTFGVTFEDNQAYGNGLGHDVHLVRLEEGTTVDDVNSWVDYVDVGEDGFYADSGALVSTGDEPGPETFLGGVEDVFAGEYPVTAYFEADLDPGEYVLVSEIPDPASSGHLVEFSVSTPSEVAIVGTHDHESDEHAFESSSATVTSGWTAIEFQNETEHTHLVYGLMVPDAEEKLADVEGDGLAEKYMNAVSIPFQEAWDPYWAGDATVEEFLAALGENLPAWFFEEVLPVGGPGLTSGETTSRTMLNLAPGTYFFECYVMNDEGVFHSRNGMLTSLEVTQESSTLSEPEPTLEATVSSDGIDFDGTDVAPGSHTVGVTFEDNQAYGNGLGHDVNLVRLEEGTTVEDVNNWVDYIDVGEDGFYADRGALVSTGEQSGPETFIGGVQDVFAGEYPVTAYFDADLEVGDYALVSEIPDPMASGHLVEFTVVEPTPTKTPTETRTPATESTPMGTTEPAEQPGFGLVPSLASIGGVAYLLARRLRRSGNDDQ